MKQVEVRKELARARAGLYRFLGGLYIMEVDEETLANMKQMQFPTDCANEELAEAYRGLEKAIADLNNEDLEDVAADYAKTFLAAGEATGVAAFPYESIYTNKKREIGGRTEQETLALYALHGWEPSKDMFRTMNDHIGLELEFMAVLCEEELLSCQTDNADRAAMSSRDQNEFLRKHLKWAGAFCMDISKYAQTAFYQAVGKVTNVFLEQEREMLAMGGEGDLIDRLKEMNIAPLAISYEYDPCDFLKAREFQLKRDIEGYKKTTQDDLINMQTGLFGYKGKVHFQVASCINDELEQIDRSLPKPELCLY